MALPTAGLALRYRVGSATGLTEGGPIASIPDTSTTPKTAAAQTTLGKRPVARQITLNGKTFWAAQFDGIDDALALSGTALSAATNQGRISVFVVSRSLDDTAAIRYSFGLATNTATSARVQVATSDTAVGSMRAGGRRLDTNSLSTTSSPAGSYTTSEWSAWTGDLNYANTDVRIIENGTVQNENLNWQTAGNTSATASAAGHIGSLTGTTSYWNGFIAEVLVYQGAVNYADVHSYLQDTYGIPVSDYVAAPGTPISGTPATKTSTLSFGQARARDAATVSTFYRFDGNSLSPTETTPGFTGTPITGGPGLRPLDTAAADTAVYDSAPVLKAQSLVQSATIDDAVANGTYFEFTLNRSGGGVWNPQAIYLRAAKGGSGLRGFGVRSSADNYASSIIGGAQEVPTTRPTWTDFSAPITAVEDTTGPLTFRVYIFSPTTSNSVEFDDIEITARISLAQSATPASRPSTLTFGSTSGSVQAPSQTGTPTTFVEGISYGQATALPGAVAQTPATRPSTLTFGQATGTAAAPTLTGTPATRASTTTFGSATPVPGAISGTPATRSSTIAYGAPTALPGTIAQTAASRPSTLILGVPTALPGNVTGTPTTLLSTVTFGQPSGTAIPVLTGTPTTLAGTVTFGQATALPGAISGTPTTFVEGISYGQATAVPGPRAGTPSTLPSTASYGTATALPGDVSGTPTTVPSGLVLGQPAAVSGATAATPTTLPSTTSFGQATAVAGAVTGTPTTFVEGVTFGQASALPGTVTGTPGTIAGNVKFGSITLVSAIARTPSTRSSTLAFGAAVALPGVVTGKPSTRQSSLSFGQPALLPGAVVVEVAGIASTLTIGTIAASILGGAQNISVVVDQPRSRWEAATSARWGAGQRTRWDTARPSRRPSSTPPRV